MKAAIVFMAALSLGVLWEKMTRPTNSAAAASRGRTAFESNRPADAVSEFSTAASLDPTTRNLFNLGTAQVAAGERAAGAATLTKVMNDRSLRTNALFNRGNAALAADDLDAAIRDYTEALRIAPKDVDAKRNLEIALRRQESKEQQQAQSGGKNPQQGGGNEQQQQTPSPAQQKNELREGEADAEALLRSVQQQEQEELARMKRARGDTRRVGW